VRFEGEGHVQFVVTKRGRRIDCDFAVIGVGVEPVADFISGSGIETDNGILVDEHCRTTVGDIYAAGDVANYQDPVFAKRRRVEHWGHAEYCGQLAGQNMAGANNTYDLVTYVWSDIFDLHLEFAGDETEHDQVLFRGRFENRSFTVLYLKRHILTAYFAVNASSKEFPILQHLIRHKRDLAGRELQLQDPTYALKGLL